MINQAAVRVRRVGLLSLWQGYRGELVLSVAWFVIGLALRLPYLLSAPRFTDEGFEVCRRCYQ